jgi:hypothetical protein
LSALELNDGQQRVDSSQLRQAEAATHLLATMIHPEVVIEGATAGRFRGIPAADRAAIEAQVLVAAVIRLPDPTVCNQARAVGQAA